MKEPLTMYRLTVQYERPADPAEFDAHYFGRHVQLCAVIPGLQASTFSKPRVIRPGMAPYLVAELDFADEAAFNGAMGSPEMAAVAKDAEALPAARVMFIGELSSR